MSLAVIESLACGAYVIATPASGNAALVKAMKHGELTGFKDVNAVSKKIEAYYTQRFLNGNSTNGQAFGDFKTTYDWQPIIKQYVNKLSTLV